MNTTLPLHFTAVLSMLKSGWFALTAGSRTIPLGDNGAVIKELAVSTARQKMRAEPRDPFRRA